MKTTILTTAALLLSLTSVNASELSHIEKVNALPVIGNFLTKAATSHYKQVKKSTIISSFVEEAEMINNSHYSAVNKLPVIGSFMKDSSEVATPVYASHHEKISKLPVIGNI